MPERGAIKFDLERGATVAEFRSFLADLEGAYIALYSLPTRRRYGRLGPLVDILGYELLPFSLASDRVMRPDEVHPDDQLELSRISIQSPGWGEFIGALNPLRELRDYLKDRHERTKDKRWRDATDHDRAVLENDLLRAKAEREHVGALSDFHDLMERAGISQEDRQRIMWEKLGLPMKRLGRHQDSGLLGDQTKDHGSDDIGDLD